MYVFIVNPIAGKGKAIKIYDELKKAEVFKQIHSKKMITEYHGHGRKLAREAVEMYRDQLNAIIVIGGDGTFHEVLNGVMEFNDIPLSFIPAGSGNDFARGFQVKGTPTQILEKTVEERSVTYWPGVYTVDNQLHELFANSIGFGFDAEIVREANQSNYKALLNKWKLGTFTYVISLLKVLRKFEPKNVELVIDGNKEYLDNVWMVTVSNHPYYGGGMKIIPNAIPQPKHFPVLIIRNISHWKVLALFLTVFWGGHIRFKEVSLRDASNLQIYSEQSPDYQVDGQSGTCFHSKIGKQTIGRKVYGAKLH